MGMARVVGDAVEMWTLFQVSSGLATTFLLQGGGMPGFYNDMLRHRIIQQQLRQRFF
jgi:hypothetical protein